MNFKKKRKPQDPGEKKQERKVVFKNLYDFFEGRKKVLNVLKVLLIVKYFQ